MEPKVLIIDDEPQIRSLLEKILSLEGFRVAAAEDITHGLELMAGNDFHVVVTDVKLPDGSGIELTKKIKTLYPQTEVIVLTAFGQIKDGVEAMKNGAFDYMMKGDDDDKVPLTVRRASEKAMLSSELNDLRRRIDNKYAFSKIIGRSQPIAEAIEFAKKAAPTDTTILLLGETGTGKELFAQAIHNASPRRSRNFVAVNCSAIAKDLQESEFFGHKKGAFTGAVSDKKGYFEEANGGTILLDEVGEMSLQTQAKLLRTIEERSYMRLGDPKERTLDIRIIAATNRDLRELIKEGMFREDLFYRLNAFSIHLPSLAERIDDIEILSKHFVGYYSDKLGKNIEVVTTGFIEKLKMHKFGGNIRELKNIIERAVVLAPSGKLDESLLPEETCSPINMAADESLELIEKKHILKVLELHGGNKTQAARSLGIGTVTLYRKLKQFGLDS